MPDSRSGFHGDINYVFEDNGFNTSPTDTTFKAFGSNATLDTFDGSREAVRVFNADRTASDIVRQVFDGAWSITHEVSTPLWYLAGLYGQPLTTQVTTGLYEHVYDLANNSDPVSLRLYGPTEGFTNYRVLPGCVISSVDIDQSQPNNPEVTISGAYAEEPFEATTLDPVTPSLSETTYTNRDGELQINGDTVGRTQSASVSLDGGQEMVNEIGAEGAVDFREGAFNPSATHDKILYIGQTVDFFNRFSNANQVNTVLSYDNGATGTDEYSMQITVSDAFPDQFTEGGRNDPEAELTEELQEMGQDATVAITNDAANPPGV